ncbi:MAG: hotdog fold thioesterase [Methylocystaceae bacterium]
MIYPLDLEARTTIMQTLDITMEEMTPERVVFSMPVTPKVHQPYGLLHGGVSLVLAETVASAGSVQFVDNATQMVVGLEINANHLRSVSQGTVRAVGIPLHIGKRTVVWEIKIYDDNDQVICISRCTIAIINLKSL